MAESDERSRRLVRAGRGLRAFQEPTKAKNHLAITPKRQESRIVRNEHDASSEGRWVSKEDAHYYWIRPEALAHAFDRTQREVELALAVGHGETRVHERHPLELAAVQITSKACRDSNRSHQQTRLQGSAERSRPNQEREGKYGGRPVFHPRVRHPTRRKRFDHRPRFVAQACPLQSSGEPLGFDIVPQPSA